MPLTAAVFPLDALHASSPWGPALCGMGIVALAVATVVHGVWRWPTILPPSERDGARWLTWKERVSVHLVVYGAWAVGFGAVIWRGAPLGAIDVRFGFERRWPVLQSAEWIYLSIYIVPLLLPWLAQSREALRRYALNLWWLLFISDAMFLLLPFVSPPRTFVPDSTAGKILAWETGRTDFAAAALPSFHVLWAWLCADLLATLGSGWKWSGRLWALAVTMSCVANGAHGIVDVGAALVIYPLIVSPRSPVRRVLDAAESRLFSVKQRIAA